MLPEGNHNLRLEKQDYLPVFIDDYKIDNDNNTINQTLTKNEGFIDLIIKPDSTIVKINNKVITYIPEEQLNLTPGDYFLDFACKGYVSQRKNISIVLQETLPVSVELKKNVGYFCPLIYPKDSILLINGKKIEDRQIIELVPGDYAIKLSKENYTTLEENITVNLDDVIHKDYIIKKEFKKVSFESNAINSKFRVLQNNKIFAEWYGDRQFGEFPTGKYLVICTKKGYMRQSDEIDIQGGNSGIYRYNLSHGSDIPENMVFVKGGAFNMGSNDRSSSEKPVHSVTLSDFYIGKYEVTQKEWQIVMGNNPSKFNGDNLPVEQISWFDAIEFCNKRSVQEGLQPCYTIDKRSNDIDFEVSTDQKKWIVSFDYLKNGYRLLTEAEWEFAARGGNKTKGYKYSGSNDIGSVAWYRNNSGSKTHSAGGKKANELGIYDMSGNVWEWCWDWYGEYSSSSQNNPRGLSSSSNRVRRGGSWFAPPYNRIERIADRGCTDPGYGHYDHGFRLARSSK